MESAKYVRGYQLVLDWAHVSLMDVPEFLIIFAFVDTDDVSFSYVTVTLAIILTDHFSFDLVPTGWSC